MMYPQLVRSVARAVATMLKSLTCVIIGSSPSSTLAQRSLRKPSVMPSFANPSVSLGQ